MQLCHISPIFTRYPFTTTPPSLAPKLFTAELHSPVLACFATTNPRPSLLRQSFCVLPTKPLNFALHLLHSHITLFFCTCFDTIHSCSAPHLLRCRAALPIFSHGVYSAPTSYAHLFCLSTPMSHFLPIFPRARPFFLVSFSQLTGHDLRLSFVRGAFCSLLRTCCAAVRSPVFFVYFYNSASLLSLPFSEILFSFSSNPAPHPCSRTAPVTRLKQKRLDKHARKKIKTKYILRQSRSTQNSAQTIKLM